VDIAGAKALKERLGLNRAAEAPSAAPEVEIPEDMPPVYHWVGVTRPASSASSADGDEPAGASLFNRLGLSSR
jgi:hypothetical protein